MKIVGLESVRRGYCNLTRRMQKWALKSILDGMGADDIRDRLRATYKEMLGGKYDKDLIITMGINELDTYNYKKRGSKGLPHYRAAVMAKEAGYPPRYDISFMYSGDDVRPILDGIVPGDINHKWYYERQILGVIEPLIASVQIQTGTYHKAQRKRKTICHAITDFPQHSS